MVFSCKTATLWSELQVPMGPRPHLSFCACKTTWLPSEILVSMGPRPNLSFCACKTAWFAPELLVSMGPRPHLSFCACKTTWLASEILVSMGPSPQLWFFMQNSVFRTRITSLCGSHGSPMFFLHSKQRLYHQNYKSLLVPALICGIVYSQQPHYNQN